MKKKGFTLVELLAVIVILAIIVLIAIPLIGNVIEKAKIGALESSVNGLVESANMYYANNTIKGETISETIFDFEDGEQVGTEKLEYKGKVYNGKLILHANGEVAVCIDDEEHYAYKNKDTDEIVSGNGTCLYDGTTGDFSSNSGITDLRGKTLVATQIEESGDNAIITIPEEGYVDSTSKISVPIETLKNEIDSLSSEIKSFSSNNGANSITIDVGFRPSNVIIYTHFTAAGSKEFYFSNYAENYAYAVWLGNNNGVSQSVGISLTDTGFVFNFPNDIKNYRPTDVKYIVIK